MCQGRAKVGGRRDTAIAFAAVAAALGALAVCCASVTAPTVFLEVFCTVMFIFAAVLIVMALVTLMMLAVSEGEVRSKKRECSALRDEMANRFETDA